MTMQEPLALIIVAAQFSAALALFNGVITTIGQSKITVAAIEAIARQPGSAGSVTSTMFVGLAMAETSGIYGLLIAIILLFANPLISQYMQFIGG
jgi:F-type H+-transporting ATPase subunit c